LKPLHGFIVAGITFEESSRKDNLSSSMARLKELLPENVRANQIIYKWQTEDRKYSLVFLIKRLFSQWYLERTWHFQNGSNLNFFTSFAYLIYRVFKFMIWNKKLLNDNVNINNILAHKHYQIWNYFLNSDEDFMIVLEDDVQVQNNFRTKTVMNQILDRINLENDKIVYIDLGGGLTVEQMKIEKQVKIELEPFMELSILSSRTTCGYLINKKAASYFVNVLNGKQAKLDLYPIDWIINLIGIIVKKKHEEFLCIHTQPPIFSHGSVDKKFPSFIPRG
jgi:hypothetical protein